MAERSLLVAFFGDDSTFGDVELEARNGEDGFIFGISPSGIIDKAESLYGQGPGSDRDIVNAIVRTASGNYLLGGYFRRTDLFLGDEELLTNVDPGDEEAFLIEVDDSLNVNRKLSYSGEGSQEVRGLSVAPNGDVLVAGSGSGELPARFAETPDSFSLLGSAGDVVTIDTQTIVAHQDGYIAAGRRLSASFVDGEGELVWNISGNDGDDYFGGSALLSSGELLLAGSYDESPNGDFPDEAKEDAAGVFDILLLWLDPSDGSYQRHLRFGSAGEDEAFDLIQDQAGNVIVVGRVTGPVDFGGGPIFPSPVDAGAFAASFSPSGEHLWSFGIPGTNASFRAVSIDSAGALYFTGIFEGFLSFSGQVLESEEQDVFALKISPSWRIGTTYVAPGTCGRSLQAKRAST